MCNGIFEQSNEGTPQGGPLSPLLSNLVLDELDKELEKRGHEFSRYADDGLMNVNSWVLVFMEIESRSAKHLLRSLSHVSVKLPAVFEERRFKTVIKVLTTFLRGWQGYYGNKWMPIDLQDGRFLDQEAAEGTAVETMGTCRLPWVIETQYQGKTKMEYERISTRIMAA